MRLSLICVGRLKAGPERELFVRYEKRFAQIGRQIGLSPLKLVELPESRSAQASARQNEEARAILGKCPDGIQLILLDEHGTSLTSIKLADFIGSRRDAGTSEICFVIGGPDGHGEAVRKTAKMVLGFGQMTLSHGLARVVLSEQLYRASTILAGHPYHRE